MKQHSTNKYDIVHLYSIVIISIEKTRSKLVEKVIKFVSTLVCTKLDYKIGQVEGEKKFETLVSSDIEIFHQTYLKYPTSCHQSNKKSEDDIPRGIRILENPLKNPYLLSSKKFPTHRTTA